MSDPTDRSPAGPDPERASEPERTPALRASDADRERVVELLRKAASDGRLDVEELDERSADAYAARTLPELARLTEDLVAAPEATVAPTGRTSGGPLVRPGPGGTRLIVSVMGGNDRRGRWRVAPHCFVLSVMGGADLDLCDAELADHETRIFVLNIMGGSQLRLPSGADVRVGRFAVMGGHDVKLDVEAPPPDAPVIRLRMFSLMGGGEVRQGPKRRKRARRDRELPPDASSDARSAP